MGNIGGVKLGRVRRIGLCFAKVLLSKILYYVDKSQEKRLHIILKLWVVKMASILKYCKPVHVSSVIFTAFIVIIVSPPMIFLTRHTKWALHIIRCMPV